MAAKIELREPESLLTLSDIELFEKEIGGRLSDDYKRFLLANNGGWTEPLRGLRSNGRLK